MSDQTLFSPWCGGSYQSHESIGANGKTGLKDDHWPKSCCGSPCWYRCTGSECGDGRWCRNCGAWEGVATW